MYKTIKDRREAAQLRRSANAAIQGSQAAGLYAVMSAAGYYDNGDSSSSCDSYSSSSSNNDSSSSSCSGGWD